MFSSLSLLPSHTERLTLKIRRVQAEGVSALGEPHPPQQAGHLLRGYQQSPFYTTMWMQQRGLALFRDPVELRDRSDMAISTTEPQIEGFSRQLAAISTQLTTSQPIGDE